MKRVLRGVAGLGVAAALIAPLPASAADIWHYYPGDGSFAFLAVVDETAVEEAEAYYPFTMDCATDRDWTMRITGLDNVALGDAIANGERPVFTLLFDGSEDDFFSQYLPQLDFGEMWGEWEYATNWSPGVLDRMLAAKETRVRGPGVDMVLPAGGAEAIGAFKAACEKIDAARG